MRSRLWRARGPVTGGGSVTEEEGEHIGATQSPPLPVTGKEMILKAGNDQQTGAPSLPEDSVITQHPAAGGHEAHGARCSLHRRATPLVSHSISFSQPRKAGLREASGLSKGHSWETGQEEQALLRTFQNFPPSGGGAQDHEAPIIPFLEMLLVSWPLADQRCHCHTQD